MTESIRAFIAIKIPPLPPLREVLSSLAGMGNALRAVAPENLHLTLKFLGDITEPRVPEVASMMQNAANGLAVPVVKICGLGAFPHLRRPTVVWAGMTGFETVEALALDLELWLQPLGYPLETRGFQPHVTLARVKRKPPPELADLIRLNAATDFGELTLSCVELFRSDLTPDGPKYTVLATAAFGGS